MIDNYILLVLAAVCIAGMFSLKKYYQEKFADKVKSVWLYSAITAASSIVMFLILNGFKLRFESLSFVLAVILAVISTLNGLLGIIVVKYGEVSVYTVFMMLGGMLLPYAHGILFLQESPSICSIIGIVILVFAIILPVIEKLKEKAKNAKLFTLLCVTVFILNGCVSIFSKLSRIIDEALPVYDFLIWHYIFVFLYSILFVWTLHIWERRKNLESVSSFIKAKTNKEKSFAVCVIIITALVSSVGYLFQLIGAESLPSTVLYPIVSGGSIVLTAIAGRCFFKEKISFLKIMSIVLTLVGTTLFCF